MASCPPWQESAPQPNPGNWDGLLASLALCEWKEQSLETAVCHRSITRWQRVEHLLRRRDPPRADIGEAAGQGLVELPQSAFALADEPHPVAKNLLSGRIRAGPDKVIDRAF